MTFSGATSGPNPSAHSRNRRSNCRNIIAWKTRFIVSCDGIPFGSRSLF